MMVESMLAAMDLVARSLDVESTRKTVIADNLANAETPYFKRSMVTFEKELFRAMKSEHDSVHPFAAKMTNEKHIPFERPKDYRDVTGKIQVDYPSSYTNAENNVDPEKEMVDWVKANERYEAMTTILDRYFRRIKMALR